MHDQSGFYCIFSHGYMVIKKVMGSDGLNKSILLQCFDIVCFID